MKTHFTSILPWTRGAFFLMNPQAFMSRSVLKHSSNKKLSHNKREINKLEEVRKGTQSRRMEERLIKKLCCYPAFNVLGKIRPHRCWMYTQQPTVTKSSLELHFHKSHSQVLMPITATPLPGEHRLWKPLSISYKLYKKSTERVLIHVLTWQGWIPLKKSC